MTAQTEKTKSQNLIDTVEKILAENTLCDHCLGRLFAWLSTDTTNEERGRSLKLTLSMNADEQIKSGLIERGKGTIQILAENGLFAPARIISDRYAIEYSKDKRCCLCNLADGSVFERVEDIVNRIVDTIKDLEFDTFLVGCVPAPSLADKQDEIRAANGLLHAETLKSHFNRELGRTLSEVLEQEVEFKRPDVVFIYDMKKDSASIQINPVFIYGRYKKHKRGIPQSRWDCKPCRGKGCEECGGTGRKYPDSISEYIGIPFQTALKGSRFKVHAAGREDIDVLMLGTGRPFVVEVSEPRIRHPDLLELAKSVSESAKDKVTVHNLAMTDRKKAQTLKAQSSENIKEYVATISTEEPVREEKLRSAEQKLSGIEIEQRTPQRVSHRRSDLIRVKKIHSVELSKADGLLQGHFKVQGGTYVKELISGDDGRTKPSLTDALGTLCTCETLDVTAIYSTDSDHNA